MPSFRKLSPAEIAALDRPPVGARVEIARTYNTLIASCNLRLSSRHFYRLKISTKTCTFPSSGHQLALVIALLSRSGVYGVAQQSFPIVSG